MLSSYSLLKLPETERPRERLATHGSEAVSTMELLAIILGSGTRTMPVLKLAQELMARFGTLHKLTEATLAELCQIPGLGQAKAIQIKAAISLGMRAAKQAVAPRLKVEHPTHAYHLIKDEVERETRELFLVILLDTKGGVITHQVVSVGTLAQALIHPREVFYPAIRHKAASIILVHNHPSGDATPSKQDHEITESLISVGKIMGIPVQDHLIVGHGTFTSLRQEGVCFSQDFK